MRYFQRLSKCQGQYAHYNSQNHNAVPLTWDTSLLSRWKEACFLSACTLQ